MRHLAQVVRNGLGDRAGTCIDPKTQIVQGKTVCVVSCQRSPEPVFLKWKGMEASPDGDFFVRSGPGTDRLPPDSPRSTSGHASRRGSVVDDNCRSSALNHLAYVDELLMSYIVVLGYFANRDRGPQRLSSRTYTGTM